MIIYSRLSPLPLCSFDGLVDAHARSLHIHSYQTQCVRFTILLFESSHISCSQVHTGYDGASVVALCKRGGVCAQQGESLCTYTDVRIIFYFNFFLEHRTTENTAAVAQGILKVDRSVRRQGMVTLQSSFVYFFSILFAFQFGPLEEVLQRQR